MSEPESANYVIAITTEDDQGEGVKDLVEKYSLQERMESVKVNKDVSKLLLLLLKLDGKNMPRYHRNLWVKMMAPGKGFRMGSAKVTDYITCLKCGAKFEVDYQEKNIRCVQCGHNKMLSEGSGWLYGDWKKKKINSTLTAASTSGGRKQSS